MKLKKILMAEDNELDAELTLEALKESKLANKVDWVRDGQEALDYLRCKGEYSDREAEKPLFVLLDIKMPKVSGLEVLEEIRKDSKLKLLPVVLLTSSREENDLISGYELGANAYVVKPVDYAKFIETVNTLGQFWAVINEPPETECGDIK